MSKNRLNLITLGIMLSLFLASMEGTVVATAMPTIVGQLGGLSIYSWVFAVYMLASTTTVPIYGKLSDLYGRKQVYAVSMILFLAGSILCSQAQTMEQLVLFRGIQGLGAGGVLPLAFTIIGEIFDLEQRARMQGLFSGVWGVSSVIGPVIGGFLVDQVSWHWVFLINVIPGTLASRFGVVCLAEQCTCQNQEGQRRLCRRRPADPGRTQPAARSGPTRQPTILAAAGRVPAAVRAFDVGRAPRSRPDAAAAPV